MTVSSAALAYSQPFLSRASIVADTADECSAEDAGYWAVFRARYAYRAHRLQVRLGKDELPLESVILCSEAALQETVHLVPGFWRKCQIYPQPPSHDPPNPRLLPRQSPLTTRLPFGLPPDGGVVRPITGYSVTERAQELPPLSLEGFGVDFGPLVRDAHHAWYEVLPHPLDVVANSLVSSIAICWQQRADAQQAVSGEQRSRREWQRLLRDFIRSQQLPRDANERGVLQAVATHQNVPVAVYSRRVDEPHVIVHER
jgi:hypothetical protein